jgi:hypothetical protein
LIDFVAHPGGLLELEISGMPIHFLFQFLQPLYDLLDA